MKQIGVFVFAVAACYLIMVMPIAFAQAVSVSILDPFGTSTEAVSSIPSPDTLVNKEVVWENSPDWAEIDLKITITPSTHPIKKGYVYLCKDMDPSTCLHTLKTPSYTLADRLEEKKRAWEDASDVNTVGANNYPQTANVLSIVNIDVDGRSVWLGMWDSITRTSLETFQARNYDLKGIDVILEKSEYASLVSSYINKSFMIPTRWVKEIVFGSLENLDTKVSHGLNFEQTDSPEKFATPTKLTLTPLKIASKNLHKTFSIQFPGTSTTDPLLTGNGLTFIKTPAPECGDGDCEEDAGETGGLNGSCCRDCGCPDEFICSYTKDAEDPGKCVNESEMRLAVEKVKTKYNSCELSHDVEFRARITRPTPDASIEEWWAYINDTSARASCKKTTGSEYACEIAIEEFEECVEGTHELKNNKIFARIRYAGKGKVLNATLPTITIKQETESMAEINEWLRGEFDKIFSELQDGVDEAKELLELCVKMMRWSVYAGMVAVGATILVGALELSGVIGGSGGTSEATGGTGPVLPIKSSSVSREETCGRKLYFAEALAMADAPKGTKGAQQLSIVIGRATDEINSYGLLFANTFMTTVSSFSQIGLGICHVASTILELYVRMSEAMTDFLQFQVCVRTYQNFMGKGPCNGKNPKNPQASMSAATSCLQMLAGCMSHMDRMTTHLKELNQFTKQEIEGFKQDVPGSRRVSISMQTKGPRGQAYRWDACGDEEINFEFETLGCTGQAKVTKRFVSPSGVTSGLKTKANVIESYSKKLASLAGELTAAGTDKTKKDGVFNDTKVANGQVKVNAQAIKNTKGTQTGVTQAAITIYDIAGQIEDLVNKKTLDAGVLLTYSDEIQVQVAEIKRLIESGTETEDITEKVSSYWGEKWIKATSLFGVPGKYEVTFNCPGVNSKSVTVEYAATCPAVGAKPDTQKAASQIDTAEKHAEQAAGSDTNTECKEHIAKATKSLEGALETFEKAGETKAAESVKKALNEAGSASTAATKESCHTDAQNMKKMLGPVSEEQKEKAAETAAASGLTPPAASGLTPPAASGLTPPAASGLTPPAGFSGSYDSSAKKVTLTWNKVNGADGYEIQGCNMGMNPTNCHPIEKYVPNLDDNKNTATTDINVAKHQLSPGVSAYKFIIRATMYKPKDVVGKWSEVLSVS